MFKKTVKIMFAAIAVAILAGCYSFKNNHRTVMDVVEHFKFCNVQVDVIQPLFPYFGSESAICMHIAGKEVGIYKFNANIDKQRERLKHIIDEGCVYVEGKKYPVIVNGSFMMFGHEVNPECIRLIEVFNSFPN